VSRVRDPVTEACDAVEDLIGRLGPHERLGVAVGELDCQKAYARAKKIIGEGCRMPRSAWREGAIGGDPTGLGRRQ
jgi:hypothetical protein